MLVFNSRTERVEKRFVHVTDSLELRCEAIAEFQKYLKYLYDPTTHQTRSRTAQDSNTGVRAMREASYGKTAHGEEGRKTGNQLWLCSSSCEQTCVPDCCENAEMKVSGMYNQKDFLSWCH